MSEAPDERAALAFQISRWRQLFDVALDGYVVTDAAGIIVDANRQAVELLGRPVRRPGRQPLVLLIVPDDRQAVQRMLRAGNDGDPGEAIEVRLRDVDADTFRAELRCVPIDGQQLLWLIRDVTTELRARIALEETIDREREAVEQLRKLDAMRRAFLLAVSHDLRTPLAAIRSLAAALAAPRLDAGQRSVVLERIQEVVDDTMTLLGDLLDYERLTAGTMPLLRHHIDASEVVRAAVAPIPLDGHVLHVDLQPTPAQLDAVPLERIAVNLMRNAVQHTAPGSNIWLSCCREPDGVLLVVADDGGGVPDERRDTVFEPFERDREGRRRGGLGVGLALVRRFAELHGGFARVERRQGGGAAFHVLLPD